MQAIYWESEKSGSSFEYRPIPEAMVEEAKAWRVKLVEAAAEASDELMEHYLEHDALSEEQIKQGIRLKTLANECCPVFCGSAFKNKGVQPLLDGVVDYFRPHLRMYPQ